MRVLFSCARFALVALQTTFSRPKQKGILAKAFLHVKRFFLLRQTFSWTKQPLSPKGLLSAGEAARVKRSLSGMSIARFRQRGIIGTNPILSSAAWKKSEALLFPSRLRRLVRRSDLQNPFIVSIDFVLHILYLAVLVLHSDGEGLIITTPLYAQG